MRGLMEREELFCPSLDDFQIPSEREIREMIDDDVLEKVKEDDNVAVFEVYASVGKDIPRGFKIDSVAEWKKNCGEVVHDLAYRILEIIWKMGTDEVGFISRVRGRHVEEARVEASYKDAYFEGLDGVTIEGNEVVLWLKFSMPVWVGKWEYAYP